MSLLTRRAANRVSAIRDDRGHETVVYAEQNRPLGRAGSERRWTSVDASLWRPFYRSL